MNQESDTGRAAGGALVRRARPEDLPAVEGLLRQIMADHGVTPPAGDSLRTVTAGIIGHASLLRSDGDAEALPADTRGIDSGVEGDHLFLVAEWEGRVVAMCALLFSLSTWSTSRICELQDVVVAAPFRGRGIGRVLLEGAVTYARSRGCTRVTLTAETENLPAHAFYRSLGFEEKAVMYFERDTRA